MKQIILIFIMLTTAGMPSCSSFLEEYSQNLSYVTCTEDLRELLIGNAYLTPRTPYTAAAWLNAMDDDTSEFMTSIQSTTSTSAPGLNMRGFHEWHAYPYYELTSSSVSNNYGGNSIWKDLYAKISGCNIILKEVEKYANNEDEAEGYRRVKGEALTLRGMYYFFLVNLWAAPYDATTANRDLGVPVKTTEYIENEGFARNTVAECYARITEDLETAIPLLDGLSQPSTFRATANAARAFLSRVYLYTGEWQRAYDLSTTVLDHPGSARLMDLNAATSKYSTEAFTNAYSYAETIFNNGANGSWMTSSGLVLCASDELYNSFTTADLRKTKNFKTTGSNAAKRIVGVEASTSSSFSPFSICIAEVYLNQAEAAAMLNLTENAISAIKTLRQHRMSKNIETTDYSVMDNQQLVTFIREERRRELAYRGHRWFDLRRYAVSPKYPVKTTIRHRHVEWAETSMITTGYYRLNEYPQDSGWILPFPTYALQSNEGKLVDNERPERAMTNE